MKECDNNKIHITYKQHLNIVNMSSNIAGHLSLLLHREFRRITLIINQQMHLHKISH